MVEDDSIRAVLLSDFGVTATLPGGSNVLGIWDDAFLMVSDDHMEVAASEPQFYCRTTDVSGLNQGDAITIGAITYYVNSVQPDGTGFSALSLHT